MIYKPTTAYPCGSAVNTKTDEDGKEYLPLKCSTLSSSEITKSRLTINDKTYKYHFSSTLNNGLSPTITRKNNAVDIVYNLDDNLYSYGAEYSTGSQNGRVDYKLESEESPISPLSIINTNKELSWSIRMYDDLSDTWIGYGFVQDYEKGTLKENYSSDSSYWDLADSLDYYKIKISPHVNIDNTFKIHQEDLNHHRTIVENYLNFKDSNAKYYFYHNGYKYEIVKFINYEYDGNGESMAEDSYGNLLYTYAIIKKQEGDFFKVGDSYTLFCNYIDSDEYYFSVKKPSSIVLLDRFGREIKDGMVDYLSDTNTLKIKYSDFYIKATYLQSDGAVVNYYNFILEKITDNNFEIIDETGNVYASTIEYKYSNLMANEKYKLYLQVVDTNSIITSKELIIIPNYEDLVAPQIIETSYYPQNYSCIVDFSKLISITGYQKSEGAYEYKHVNDDGTLTDVSDDNPSNACYLYPENVISYKEIDGVGEIDLTDNFSIYMKVKINSDVQHIIDIKTDKVDMYLNWEKTYFKFGSKVSSSPFYFYHEYSPYQPTTNGMLPANYLSDNLSKQQEHLDLELASGQFISNISFPWMWQDNLIWNDYYFWHDESILDNSWWEIIITYQENGRLCAFFKNMLSDTKWTGILTKSDSDSDIQIGVGGIDYPILKDGV